MNSMRNLLRLMRPVQWLKNIMLFFPPFLSGSLIASGSFAAVAIASFVAFCCIASATYIINDLFDIGRDSSHPVKSLRPIPSGDVSKTAAVMLAIFLALTGITLATLASKQIIPFILLYGLMTIAYSAWLKNIPIVDLFCISFGFLIRLEAGGSIFKVEISEWLFLSVLFLSLFLSSGKRLAEQNLLGDKASGHRASLIGYPEGTLAAFLHITAATVLVTYTMYSLAHPRLVYSVPICTFGLFRYILRIKSGLNGDPTESLLKDIPLLCVSSLWVLMVGWSIYK
jgi:decaprenyl-phosphate phosphoribosyltransferase